MRVLFWGDQLGIVHLLLSWCLWELINLKSIKQYKVLEVSRILEAHCIAAIEMITCQKQRNHHVLE